MSINPAQLLADMLAAATGAAKGHAADLQNYLETNAKIIADGIAQLARDRLDPVDPITDDDVKFALQQIKESQATALLAVDVTVKAAAQDAINAAIAIGTAALNKAIGIALF